MNILFIGNCQALSLCFYFQQLKIEASNIYWLLYAEEFKAHIGKWANKCKNKITDLNEANQLIKKSDIIVYQDVHKNTSEFCNTEYLNKHKHSSCVLVKIPSFCLDYDDYANAISKLKLYEVEHNVDITVSDIFDNNRSTRLMVTDLHPSTLMFLAIVKKLCALLDIKYFTNDEEELFLKNHNYTELP